ncbi:unnamed protein product [Rotaria magnacalcarata]|uniref:Cysteine/serine-rich nuclear protein N-terminal domain-containing protein n=2 Tax=Rotaria magnacalcarata TaxID=392030 RepID=A0A815KMY9_9BILA|nr:unnamed protein product [Rotaria magnacalcarata]CAF2092030.1 unnamed protein product [Rotaria magnacalcarata]CAF2207515.1 unnamed protein product [Rotaria magnacalcarata]CAF4001101.1 unnamed protein product [Rotaria magnacalcarata]
MENDTTSTKRKFEDNETNDTNNSTPIIIDNDNEETKVKRLKTKKNVRFDDVTVYYFARSQGFISVPSQGAVTLGMVHEHSHVEQYSVADFSRLRRALHKSILRERKLLPPATSSTIDSDNEDDDDDNDEEPLPVDDYYFVQPIATRQRRTLLKQAGLAKIDATEKHELTLIRRSREICGCSCTRETGGCQPSTCDCHLNGIACQVDRLTFPCPCATMLCKNPLGRLEFNQNRVRDHYFETITRLEAEKNQENCILEFPIIQENNPDDLSIVAFLLSSIISEIEFQDDEIFSVLYSIVSAVDDSIMMNTESSSIVPPCNIDANIYDPLELLSTDYSMQTQRVCHINPLKVSLRRTLPSSAPMISTEQS